MTDQQQGRALGPEASDAVKTLLLKQCIADRQCLIDDQHIRTNRGGYAECQTHLHTAAVDTDRLVNIVANVCERFDFRHQAFNVA